MRNIFNYLSVTLLCVGLVGCLNDDDNTRPVSLHAVAIDSVAIGEIGDYNSVPTEITTYVTRTSSCEGFYGYDYQRVGNERTVTVYNFLSDNGNCEEIAMAQHNTLDFLPTEPGSYSFRFWKGMNEEGDNLFETYEIIIEE